MNTSMNEYSMGYSWILLLVFILIIVYFINKLLADNTSAKDILDKRYANGEIDENEYKRKKLTLQ